MAEYLITSPKGGQFKITGPDGATDEQVLAQLHAAHPEEFAPPGWSDLPGNILPSAKNFVQGMAQPVLHPVDTARALGAVAGGAAQHVREMSPDDPALRGDAPPMDKTAADAMAQFYAHRLQNPKETLITDPVGAAGDVSAVLTGAGGLGGRLPGVAGTVARAVGTAGAALDPLTVTGNALGAAGRAAKAGVAQTLGTTTGAGRRAMETAYTSGKERFGFSPVGEAYRTFLRGQGDPNDIVRIAREQVDALRNQRNTEYQREMAGANADPTILDLRPVTLALAQGRDSVRYGNNARGGAGSFSKSPEAEAVWNQINDAHNEFAGLPLDQHTVEGFDALKQRLNSIWRQQPPNSPQQRAAAIARDAVAQQITQQAPTYARTMRQYRQASEHLDDLNFSLGTGQKAKTETALRKLQYALGDTSINRRRGDLLEGLNTGDGRLLAPMIAGMNMDSIMPRTFSSKVMGSALGALSALHPAALPSLLMSSPRTMGELAHAAGRVAAAPSAVLDGTAAGYRAIRPGALAVGSLDRSLGDLEDRYE